MIFTAPWAVSTCDKCVGSFGTSGHLPPEKLVVKSHLELEGMTNTRETEAVLEKVVVLEPHCTLGYCSGKGWSENGQKGSRSCEQETVLVDSSCVWAASYRLTN